MPILRAWSGRAPAALLATVLAGTASAAPETVGGAVLTPVDLEALPGFTGSDQTAAPVSYTHQTLPTTPYV